MTRVWIYAAGIVDNAWVAEFSKATESVLANDSKVRTWIPFESERQHRGEWQFLVLITGDWRKFSRDDFFAAANALALHETGSVALITILLDSADGEEEAGSWPSRCREVWNRLSKTSVVLPVALVEPDLPLQVASIIARLHPKQRATPSAGPVTIFCSYAHRDEELRDELGRHLKSLERTGVIESWHDRRIRAGDEWSSEIDNHLYTSELILLMLSADFFASDYCTEIEAAVALRRHRVNSARAIPVLLRPVVWNRSPLSGLQALPKDARPVTEWPARDSAYVNICEGLLQAVLKWKGAGGKGAEQPETETSHRYSRRSRMVDVAMPGEIEVGRSAMVVVLIRRASSGGLRTLVSMDASFGIAPEEVRSKGAILHFPVNEEKEACSLTLTVRVQSPEFSPPRQERQVLVEPGEDTQPCILMLAAMGAGDLTVVVELVHEERIIAVCPIRTHAGEVTSDGGGPCNIRSSSIELADPDEERESRAAGEAMARAPDASAEEKELALRRVLGEVRESLAKGRSAEAIAIVERGLAEFPDSEELRDLQNEATRLHHEADRERAIRDAVAIVSRCLGTVDYEAAMEAVHRAIRRFPGDPALLAMLERVEGRRRMESPAWMADATTEAGPGVETVGRAAAPATRHGKRILTAAIIFVVLLPLLVAGFYFKKWMFKPIPPLHPPAPVRGPSVSPPTLKAPAKRGGRKAAGTQNDIETIGVKLTMTASVFQAAGKEYSQRASYKLLDWWAPYAQGLIDRRVRLEAMPEVTFTVQKDGSVDAASVLIKRPSGNAEVDADVVRAVRDGRFAPIPDTFRSQSVDGDVVFRLPKP